MLLPGAKKKKEELVESFDQFVVRIANQNSSLGLEVVVCQKPRGLHFIAIKLGAIVPILNIKRKFFSYFSNLKSFHLDDLILNTKWNCRFGRLYSLLTRHKTASVSWTDVRFRSGTGRHY